MYSNVVVIIIIKDPQRGGNTVKYKEPRITMSVDFTEARKWRSHSSKLLREKDF